MVVHCVFVIVLTIYVSTLMWGTSAQSSGPYEVVLESIKNCDDKGTGEVKVTATARTDANGKVVHTGDLTLPYGVSDKLKTDGEASIRVNGQWKPIGLVSKLGFPKACSGMKRMAPIWFTILKSANVKKLDCAIPKGNYHFVDYRIAGKIANMDSLRYGNYQVQLKFSKNSQRIGCMQYNANIVPKK